MLQGKLGAMACVTHTRFVLKHIIVETMGQFSTEPMVDETVDEPQRQSKQVYLFSLITVIT